MNIVFFLGWALPLGWARPVAFLQLWYFCNSDISATATLCPIISYIYSLTQYLVGWAISRPTNV